MCRSLTYSNLECDYGSVWWAISCCIRLAAPNVLHVGEYRKSVLSTMIGLMAAPSTRFMDGTMFMQMLKASRTSLPNAEVHVAIVQCTAKQYCVAMVAPAIQDVGLHVVHEAGLGPVLRISGRI